MLLHRLRQIEKGKRLDYFFSYYSLALFVLLAAVITVVYLLYLICFKPRPDARLLWLSDRFDAVMEAELTGLLESNSSWDLNGDGHVRISLSCVEFSAPFQELSMETKAETAILLSAGENYIIFANGFAFDWLSKQRLLASESEMSADAALGDAPLSIPMSDFPLFSRSSILSGYDGMSICVAKPPADREKYDRELELLCRLLGQQSWAR